MHGGSTMAGTGDGLVASDQLLRATFPRSRPTAVVRVTATTRTRRNSCCAVAPATPMPEACFCLSCGGGGRFDRETRSRRRQDSRYRAERRQPVGGRDRRARGPVALAVLAPDQAAGG